MRYSTVVFDFDGTIADTLRIVFEIANTLTGEFGFAPITPDEVPLLKKMSARELVTRRLNIPVWNFVKIYRLEKKGRALLLARVGEVQVFPGLAEVVAALRKEGCRVGIVTSNSHEVVAGVLASANITVDFVHAGSSFFGKDKAIADALESQKIDHASVVYVGDELRDSEACKKLGIAMIGVSWGYNDPAALRESGIGVVENAEQLKGAILTS